MNGKRVFDVACASLLLLICVPILLLVALLVWSTLGRPILFRQARPGLRGQLFILLKFRSMVPPSRNATVDQDESERLTRIGRVLRASSLDELPALINVLRGEMSLVGPRPLLPEYLPLYSPEQARRHEVRPGITGWAQVNGRNALTWEERFDLDVWYVEHQSVWLDLKILWLTVLTVLRREGISHPGHATMEKFRGSPQ